MPLIRHTWLYTWNMANLFMRLFLMNLLFKWQHLIDFFRVFNRLQLIFVRINLLFKIFDSFCYRFCNFQIMFYFLHRLTGFCLLQSVLSKCFLCVFKLLNFLFLELNFCHFSIIIGKLFIIVVICWLLVFFDLVYRFFWFWCWLFCCLFSLWLRVDCG